MTTTCCYSQNTHRGQRITRAKVRVHTYRPNRLHTATNEQVKKNKQIQARYICISKQELHACRYRHNTSFRNSESLPMYENKLGK